MRATNYIDHGPYSEFGDLLTLRLSQFTGAGYDIPNIRNKSQTVCTNHAWGSAFRGYGSPQSFMGSEVCMDVLAEKMGIDPFELRYKNIYRPGATTPTGQEPEVFCLEEMYQKIRPLYYEAKERCARMSNDKFKYGRWLRHGRLWLRPGRQGLLRRQHSAQSGQHRDGFQLLGGSRPGR